MPPLQKMKIVYGPHPTRKCFQGVFFLCEINAITTALAEFCLLMLKKNTIFSFMFLPTALQWLYAPPEGPD